MVKIIALPLLLLFSLFGFRSAPLTKGDYRAALNCSVKENGNYKLESIDTDAEGLGSELRIYRYDDMVIDEICNGAFSGTSFTTVAISNCVTIVGDGAFTGQTTLATCYFTGSEEEYQALNISYEFTLVKYYAIDEGFINYWDKEVRPNENTNICEISKDKYEYIRELYTSLTADDKAVVDAYEDKAGASIKDSIKELNQHFVTPGGAKNNEEWNQTGAITLILIIAVIGMTSITIFYLLKTKKIID